MTITKVSNGYIVESSPVLHEVYQTLDAVLERLLQHFEGRCPSFTGDKYGKVIIERGE